MSPSRSRLPRAVGYVVAWLLAAGLAVAVAVFAVSSVGASARGRGPLGNDTEVVRQAELLEGPAVVDPDAPRRSETFEDEFGRLVVECRGALAVGVEADPAPGWRTVSFEQEPDDDIDAVFSSGARSIEIEVFCNAGVPTVADREVQTLPETDD